MTVLVSDTSVLIDLERGALIDSCFSIAADFAVPDLLYKRELAEHGGAAFLARGLRVVELTREELISAQAVRRARPALSLPDAYAYSLASSRAWTLLTGDGELRSLARAERIPFAGVLWLLDQLFDGNVVEAATLIAGLEAIAAPGVDFPALRFRRGWRDTGEHSSATWLGKAESRAKPSADRQGANQPVPPLLQDRRGCSTW